VYVPALTPVELGGVVAGGGGVSFCAAAAGRPDRGGGRACVSSGRRRWAGNYSIATRPASDRGCSCGERSAFYSGSLDLEGHQHHQVQVRSGPGAWGG